MRVLTIRSMLIVRTVYSLLDQYTSTRPLHLRTLGTAVELQHHLTSLAEDMAVVQGTARAIHVPT